MTPREPAESPPGDSALAPVILGIDGGGTKTAAWLAIVGSTDPPQVIGRGSAGPSNPLAAGLPTALDNLAAAVAAAWHDAGREPCPAAAAVMAVAGAGRADMAEALLDWARQQGIAERCEMVHDAAAVLAAGTREGWGVALIAGTGSAAIGITPEGHRHVCGGWGYRFGDEGSGFWIGREMLAAVARACDGRDGPTQLTPAMLAHFQIDHARDVNAALASAQSERNAMAALAPLVAAAADAGDAAAMRLMDRAAELLAELAVTTARSAQFARGYPLALAGGVVCGSGALRDRLLARLADAELPPGEISLAPDPVEGCLRLAAQRL